ncbi:MAG TPA: hypothetical protein VHC67_06585 [Gaiellaceae bacterium]|nr:hypothetical protein [Gaiellaceae bacterium]
MLQIRTIRRSHSSANVSIAYQQVLLVGFLLWLAYGVAAGNLALIVPNTISTIVCLANIAVSLRDR